MFSVCGRFLFQMRKWIREKLKDNKTMKTRIELFAYTVAILTMISFAAPRTAAAVAFIVDDLQLGQVGARPGTDDYVSTSFFSSFFDSRSVQIYDFEGPHSPLTFAPFLSTHATNGQPVHNLGIPLELGLVFSSNVVYQGGTTGFAPYSGTTVIAHRDNPYNQPFTIAFTNNAGNSIGYDSVAIHGGDSPVAKFRLDAFGVGGNFLGSVTAPNSPGGFAGFIGISLPGSLIASIRLQGLTPDDVYFDNLTLGSIPSPQAIPEPASLALLLTGLLGMAKTRRRNKV